MSIKNVGYQILVGSINILVSEFIIINELLIKCEKMWKNVKKRSFLDHFLKLVTNGSLGL